MRSRLTKSFRQMLKGLPKDARRQAFTAYRLFKRDPYHSSLHFKRVSATRPVYSARVGASYRALGNREADDLIVWFWIGPHAEYDKIIGQLK